ncbi:MAG: Flp family type IVb pilin [Chloroflexi bacterium]|nr:Flp family type IVb pilin [Chloroflexota bacterium]
MGVLRVKERLHRALTRCFGETTEGQGLVEYALIMVLVALVAFVVMVWIGPWIGNVFSNVIWLI